MATGGRKALPAATLTVYRDLLEACQRAAFEQAFDLPGIFVAKRVKGRRYWYLRENKDGKPGKDIYAGPETPELLERIAAHRARREDARGRRSAVTLLRRAGLPSPTAEVGATLRALARAGIFRHRAVLVGTHAFATYGPLLGASLSGAALNTLDIDLAQFREIAVAIAADERVSLLEALRQADPTFRAAPRLQDQDKPTAYVSQSQNRVDILTPNRGSEREAPVYLPSIGAFAHAFRFLDFLIRDTVPALGPVRRGRRGQRPGAGALRRPQADRRGSAGGRSAEGDQGPGPGAPIDRGVVGL